MPTPAEQIHRSIVARTPLICAVTEGDERIETILQDLAGRAFSKPVPLYRWTLSDGVTLGGKPVEGAPREAEQALAWAAGRSEVAFYLYHDLHHRILSDIEIVRRLKDIYQRFRPTYSCFVFSSPTLHLPAELSTITLVVDMGLPGPDELEALFTRTASPNKQLAPSLVSLPADVKQQILVAALGLSYPEAERAFRRALVGKNEIDASVPKTIFEEKQQFIKKSGIMEFAETGIRLEDIGGMKMLKDWLVKRQSLFSEEARQFGLSLPKGVLMTGISGCGKSLFVKAIASFWNLPLLRLDMARIYGGTFGSPEEAFLKAAHTAEAVAPCVLWIDEIEAGISVQGFKAEGGAASRVLGSFLTWMQEKQGFVFVAATANGIDLLPAEILRKGRFDEIFFVSLPTKEERKQIFRIHLSTRKNNPDDFDLNLLAHGTKGFSGAEIEQAVVSAMFEAFSEKRPLQQRDIMIALDRTVPLSVTMQEQIKKIEHWAYNRAARASEKEEE